MWVLAVDSLTKIAGGQLRFRRRMAPVSRRPRRTSVISTSGCSAPNCRRPPETEAWGIVFLEAQACGLPVLVGRSGGAPETLLDVAVGQVIAGGQELCGTLVAMLASHHRRRTVGRSSFTSPAEGWDAVAGKLRGLLA